MYGYYEYTDISPEQVLQKINQTKIFEWILDRPVIFGEKYISPFRDDDKPRCFFTQREDNTILFIDFGDRTGATHRSCFRMVMDNYSPRLTLDQAVEAICEHFRISKSSTDYTPVDHKSVVQQSMKNKTRIEYIARDYDKKDKTFWNKFLISTDNLIEDNVLAVKKFTKFNKKGVMSIYPTTLCYAIDFIAHVKLYMPHNTTRFITNCDEDDIGNIDNLPHSGDKLIITKSYKDHRVIRNVLDFHSVVWLMNEGCKPNDDILKNLLSRFNHIIIFFDNDFMGFKAAYKLYNALASLSQSSKVSTRYIPVQLPYKDSGELVYKEGRKDTCKLLNKILK